MRINLKSTMLAGSILAFSSGVALAVPAMVETGSNFRSGPGTNHRVLTTIQAGQMIDVQDCNGRWCAAIYGPYQGYIAQSLLSMGQAGVQTRYVTPGYAAPTYGYSYGHYDRPYYSRGHYGPAWGYSSGVGVGIGFNFD